MYWTTNRDVLNDQQRLVRGNTHSNIHMMGASVVVLAKHIRANINMLVSPTEPTYTCWTAQQS